MTAEARHWGRRRLLQTGAAALGGAGAGWAGAAVALPNGSAQAAAPSDAVVSSPMPGNQLVPFHGPHQAGIATPPQSTMALLGLDLREGIGRAALGRMMSLLSDDAARLSLGEPALADTEPELAQRPARLTITFGFGPRVVSELIGRRGVVAPLPEFRTDRLDEAWGQTDVAVQICADDPVTVAHARRMMLKDSRDFARLRWQQDGYRRAVGVDPDGTTMRNLMGQVDGTVNPAEADPDFDRLIWSQQPGFAGGTTMLVRRIRILTETWDRVDRAGREAAVGRRLDNGAPLTGEQEHDEADFEATDDLGFPVIDPASHMARARAQNKDEHFLRRAYNYTVVDPSRPTGEDTGLVFTCFAADPDLQFVPVQQRLAEQDRLNEWITTIGSAVYAVPGGAADGEYVGQELLA